LSSGYIFTTKSTKDTKDTKKKERKETKMEFDRLSKRVIASFPRSSVGTQTWLEYISVCIYSGDGGNEISNKNFVLFVSFVVNMVNGC
jgi:hypothetical protein